MSLRLLYLVFLRLLNLLLLLGRPSASKDIELLRWHRHLVTKKCTYPPERTRPFLLNHALDDLFHSSDRTS